MRKEIGEFIQTMRFKSVFGVSPRDTLNATRRVNLTITAMREFEQSARRQPEYIDKMDGISKRIDNLENLAQQFGYRK